MYSIEFSNRFKRSYDLAKKRGFDMEALNSVVKNLAEGNKLEPKYKDHALIGNYEGCRECHIKPNWLLIYKIVENRCILYLLDTGTHSDIFGKQRK